MTQPPRKSGIRLPWSHEGDSDASQPADPPAAAADAPAPTADAPAEAASAPTAAVAGEQPGAAAEAAPEAQADDEGDSSDNALLASLITAMREVAERERESSVSNLRQAVDESVEKLRSRSAEAGEHLRQRAEGDIAAIGEWVKSETDRIAAEGERRVETRRQLLTQQLTDHEQRSGTEIESLYARVQEYERDLASFFAGLHEINDPAAFGTAAKRMPRPPSIVSATPATQATPAPTPADAPSKGDVANASEQPTADAAQAVAESTDMEPEQNPPSEEPEAPVEAEPAAGEAPTVVPDTHDARLSALGIETNGASAEETGEPAGDGRPAAPTKAKKGAGKAEEAAPDAGKAEEAAAQEAASDDANPPQESLRARLAELDAKIGPDAGAEAATATVVAAGASGELATAIVVHGLGSFGAITSFKQALERVDGVHGISLSLGPTGEFVYRATHETDFDLVAAIEQIERGTAQIERQPDGSLRVVVQRGR